MPPPLQPQTIDLDATMAGASRSLRPRAEAPQARPEAPADVQLALRRHIDRSTILVPADEAYLRTIYDRFREMIVAQFDQEGRPQLTLGFWLQFLPQMMTSVSQMKTVRGQHKKAIVLGVLRMVAKAELPAEQSQLALEWLDHVVPAAIDMAVSFSRMVTPAVRRCFSRCTDPSS